MSRVRRLIIVWMSLCLLFISNAGASDGTAIEMIGVISAVYEAGVVYFGVDSVFEEDTLRVNTKEMGEVWMPIPGDGLEAECYLGHAVRFLLDERMVSGLAHDRLVAPYALEMLGHAAGEDLRLADGFIDVKSSDALVHRFIMDDQTAVFNEISPGNYVAVIYDENTGIALEVASSNG